MSKIICMSKGLCTVIFLLIIFGGCATKETLKSITDEEILKERVMVYWNHKIKQEFDRSYNFEDPYYRKRVDVVKYIKGFKTDVVKWKSVEIKDVKIEGDSAKVALNLRHEVRLPMVKGFEHDSFVEEKWVKVDRIWYHTPEGFVLERQRPLPEN